jgi:hypothetical protein
MKIALLSLKWILFIIASTLSSILVYETINVSPVIEYHNLIISLIPTAWVCWGLVSFYISKQESIVEFSKINQAIHQILYFLLHLAVFGVIVVLVFYWYDSTKISPPSLTLPSSLAPSPSLSSPLSLNPPASSEGLGQPKKFTPDMYHPEAYKSNDFNGVISYDPNYDPRKDPVNAVLLDFNEKVVDIKTHSYEHGSMSQGGLFDKVQFIWKETGKADKTLNIEGYGITGLDDKEMPKARIFLTDEGFSNVPVNDQNGMKAYKKDNVVCMYKEESYNVSLYCVQLK